jgi:hypothetical protein
MQTVLVLVSTAVLYAVYKYASGLRNNIEAAKKSGLPYIVAPCSPIFVPWILAHKGLIPIIKLLPEPLWEEWLEYA